MKKSNKSAKHTSLEHLQGEEAERFKELCSVAYEMTIDSRQVYNRREFSADSQHSLGLVTTDIYAHWSGEYQNQYSFLHLTLQEFLAAYHISKLSPEQLLDVIDQYSSALHMRNVWKFYFGLAKFSDERLDGAKKIIQETLHDNYGGPELFPILCAYEAKQEAVVKLASSQEFRSLQLHRTYDLTALSYLMSAAACLDNKATPTTHLDCTVNGGSFDYLMSRLSDRAINNLEELTVYCDNSGLEVDTVANKYHQGSKLTMGVFKSLNKLDLSSNSNIGDDGAKMIAEGLGLSHTLIHLRLKDCGIGASGVRALMKSTCALKVLDLSFNDIGDEGARTVAGRLKNSSSMRSLNLSFCRIGPDGVRALADAISCDTAVYLMWFNDAGASIKMIALMIYYNEQTKMVRKITNLDVLCLNISHNKRISFEDGAGFALLDHFKNLTGLDFSSSYHSPYERVELVEYMLHKDNCRMLQYLSPSHNFNFCQEDITFLKLLNHDRLQQIDFFDYHFKYEEVMALARGIQAEQDFNYSQNYYPALDIDISSTVMSMEESIAFLGAFKHCNRIRNISFHLVTTTIQHLLWQGKELSSSYIHETLAAEHKAEVEKAEVEKAELVKAFEHDSMDREINLTIPGSLVETIMTIACPHRH